MAPGEREKGVESSGRREDRWLLGVGRADQRQETARARIAFVSVRKGQGSTASMMLVCWGPGSRFQASQDPAPHKTDALIGMRRSGNRGNVGTSKS